MKYIFDKIRAKRKKGFTLLEHLVVVLILAVLTAVAVPTYNRAMRRSRVADGLNMMDVLVSAQNRYFIAHGTYASNLNELNMPIKASHYASGNNIITTNFTYEKDPYDSCIYATSRQGQEFTIAKNYKTNSKIKCFGDGCDNISNYAIHVNSKEDLCVDDPTTSCELTEEECEKEGKILDEENCTCIVYEPPAPSLTYCDEENDEPKFVDMGKSCKQVQCGHGYIKYVCKGGEWVEEPKSVCLNDWLYEQCSPGEPNLTSCNCDATTPIATTCEYQDKKYQVGESYPTDTFIPDEDSSCNTGIFQGANTCYMKRLYKTCSEKGTWEDDYQCTNKSEYCSIQGLVLGEGCECVASSCDINSKPYCDGTYLTADACTRDGAIINGVPCEFLCGYYVQTATCDEKTNTWNQDCEMGSMQYYDPKLDQTKSCQGKGTAGSKCGVKKLLSVSCSYIVDERGGGESSGTFSYEPSSAWSVESTYSDKCELPEDVKNACWEGETESCTMGNGQPGTMTCRGCRWGECEQNGPQTCTGAKPKCDGTISPYEGANACTRASDPGSGGDPSLYVPCQYLCGYYEDEAVCDEVTGLWSGCTPTLKTYNPNAPRTEPCQGEGAAGSQCGVKTLESISCTHNTPYSQLNFKFTSNFGACALPDDDENACWEGATETKVQGGVTYTRTCQNCTWSAWIGQCATTPNPSGSNIRACHTKNGVTNSDLYCGTETATPRCDATTNYRWVWDFSNSTCEQISEQAEVQCPSDAQCARRRRVGAACTLQHDYSTGTDHYMFDSNTGSWGSCYPKEGSSCWKYSSLPSGVFCVSTSTGCKKARCTGVSVYNSGINDCLRSSSLTTGIAFYYGVSATNPSYAGTYGYCSDGNAYIKTTCPTQIGCGSSANTSYTPDPVTAVADPTNCSTLNTTAKYVQQRESGKCTNQTYGGQKGNITVYKCVQGTKEFVD